MSEPFDWWRQGARPAQTDPSLLGTAADRTREYLRARSTCSGSGNYPPSTVPTECTWLQTDLVGSTKLTHIAGVAKAQEVRQSLRVAICDIVEKNGGFNHSYQGDGGSFLFTGLQHPSRAEQAASEIQEMVPSFSSLYVADLPRQLELRTAVETGPSILSPDPGNTCCPTLDHLSHAMAGAAPGQVHVVRNDPDSPAGDSGALKEQCPAGRCSCGGQFVLARDGAFLKCDSCGATSGCS